MIFEHLHLAGFGIFHAAELGPLGPGLNILEGPNEAGKSTTVEFIRSLLYGFQTGRGARKFEPLRGGQHGGWALARDRHGRQLRIERKPGGAAGTAEVTLVGQNERLGLEALLHGSDRQLFSSVFAFSLQEMVGLEALQAEGVRSRIYAAATGTGAGSLLKALTATEQRADALYRPRASLPRLNTAIRERDSLRGELDRLRAELDLFNRLEGERRSLEQALTEGHQTEREAERRLLHSRACAAVWEPWVELAEARVALCRLAEVGSFPEEGVSRLEHLLQERREREARRTELRQERERLRERADACRPDDALLRARSSVREAVEALGEYEAGLRDLPLREAERDQRSAQVAEALARLGPAWDEARLAAFDLSIPREDEVRALGSQLSRTAEAAAAARAAQEAAQQEVSRREALLIAAADELERGFPVVPPAVEASADRARRLDEAVDRLELVERGADLLERDDERERELEESRTRGQARLEAIAESLSPLWALVLLPLGGGMVRLLREHPAAAVGGGLVFVVIAAGAFFLLYRQRQSAEAERERLRRELEGVAGQLEAHRRKGAETRARLEETRRTLAEIEAQVGQGLPDRAAVRALVRELQEHREQRARYEARLAVVAARRQEYEASAETCEVIVRALETATEAAAAAEARWEAWLAERYLPAGIRPESALRLFAEIQRARVEVREREELELRLQRTRVALEAFEARAADLFARVGRETPHTSRLGVAVRELQTAADEAADLFLLKSQLAGQLETAEDELARPEARLEQNAEALSRLFAAGGAEDEEGFRLRAAQWSERQQLSGEIRRLERVLESHSGLGEVRERFERELSALDHETVHLQLEAAEHARDQAREAVEATATRLAEVRHELAQLAVDERLTARLRELRSKEGELRDLSEEWAVYRVAHTLLELTRRRFEKERQPGIIRRAGSVMQQLTGGRYTGIVAPNGLEEVLLEEQDGARKGLTAWSRGTAEQLYLALRFAFVEDYNASHNAEPLPIIMDDVLVHADGYARLPHAANAIAQVARRCQVLYLTCHPEHAALLAAADPEARRFRVNSGQFEAVS